MCIYNHHNPNIVYLVDEKYIPLEYRETFYVEVSWMWSVFLDAISFNAFHVYVIMGNDVIIEINIE